MHQPPLKYRAWQPRATLTLPSTVLQRPVYNAVFTARLVGYLNCDLGGGEAVLLGKFGWSVQPRSIHANSPGYDTNLPVSRTGHHISRIN